MPCQDQDRNERLSAAIDEHAENIGKFRRAEITPEQFRPLRLAMASTPSSPTSSTCSASRSPAA